MPASQRRRAAIIPGRTTESTQRRHRNLPPEGRGLTLSEPAAKPDRVMMGAVVWIHDLRLRVCVPS